MKPIARKLTRFYIINPVGDRRLEQRFESKEQVVLRFPLSGKMGPAVAYDIGKHGMRIETELQIQPGYDVEIAFPNSADHMQCFGRIVWAKPINGGKNFEGGVSIEVWHGVIQGENSWTSKKGTRPKAERRVRPR